MTDEAPPEPFTTVTNPERFLPLHEHADAIVSNLVEGFEVTITSEPARKMGSVDVIRSVRLVPAGNCAPLDIAWTTFPGLYVQFGKWTSESFPLCGWDDCGEEPVQVAGDLYQKVKWVVDGWFREGLTADYRLFHEFPNMSSSGHVRPDALPAGAVPGETIFWRPWTPKADVGKTSQFFRRAF